MEHFKQFIKDNLIFLLVSFVPYVSIPAVVHAQSEQFQPVLFEQSLKLSRGDLSPKYPEGIWLTKEDYCVLFKRDWGWQSCEGYDAVVIGSTPDTDNLLVEVPNSDGYVKFDDWQSADRDARIDEIEDSLISGSKSQSEILGYEVKFLGWRVYPTLDAERQILYYATDVSFDGERTTNVTASLFDRKGYVTFAITPEADDLSEAEIKEIILDNLSLYQPGPKLEYKSFVTGDKVAAVGALGVLASLVGVKYGKAAGVGIVATIALLAKKGLVIILLPILWLFGKMKSLFGRREE